MDKRAWASGIVVVALSGSALGYVAGRADSTGVPATQALTYSGVLTDAAGAPLSGTKNVQVALWDAPTGGTAPRCTVMASVTLGAGTFQVILPDACTTAVHQTPDLYVEVSVDGAGLGRTKFGAVPFALEADTASNAAGPLAQQITDIGTKIQQTSCEDKGGGWDANAKTCTPFMRPTAQMYTAANRMAACTGEFPSSDPTNWAYLPCSPFQALSMSQLYSIPHMAFYWLWAGGAPGQADGPQTLFRTGDPPVLECPNAASSVSFFHSWNSSHVDALACQAATNAQRVLCCRTRLND
jgi:hypothetical protein